MSCRKGWNLLSCGSENMYFGRADPSRSVWQDGSICRCHDEIGMNCSAWCTTKAVPQAEQIVVKLDQDCFIADCYSFFKCNIFNSNRSLISCYFKGNTNSSLKRDRAPLFSMMAMISTCMVGGLANDEFVLSCMAPSNSARVERGTSSGFRTNTTVFHTCASSQGNIISCQNKGSQSPLNHAIIRNDTACECFGITSSDTCNFWCLRKTISF